MILFVLFVIIPLIEISLFIQIGGEIGIIKTMLLCVLTAMIGAVLIRWQGLQTLLSARTSMAQGGMPVRELFDGICIAAAGALLMTPGFFTDTMGFALLVPPVREALRHKVSAHFNLQPGPADPFSREEDVSGVIEVEYERVDERDKQ